ncbi:hypothetical protein AB4876_08405 [Zhongshania guokunii]|uniref:Uncharacterized protein n=1 Tax=Zhongshania guokunii TaxID=641783 RepID=A0ABV3U4P5_9GAMM
MAQPKMVYSLTAFVIVIYAIVFLRSTPPALEKPLNSHVASWTIDESGLSAGPAVIHAQLGDQLQLYIQATITDELQLSGYGTTLQLGPQSPRQFDLVLNVSGHFEFKLRNRQYVIAVLEVSSLKE